MIDDNGYAERCATGYDAMFHDEPLNQVRCCHWYVGLAELVR